MQRNARAEKVSGKGPVNTAAQNIVSVIAAEVRDRAEPASCIVGEGNTASVHAEAVDSGGSRVFRARRNIRRIHRTSGRPARGQKRRTANQDPTGTLRPSRPYFLQMSVASASARHGSGRPVLGA